MRIALLLPLIILEGFAVNERAAKLVTNKRCHANVRINVACTSIMCRNATL